MGQRSAVTGQDLRATMTDPPLVDYTLLLHEIEGQSARSAVLIAQAALETQLKTVLDARLRRTVSAAARNLLFSQDGLYGSYARKVDAAHLMDLADAATLRDLELLEKMRAECASNLHPVSFETGRLGEWFCELVRVRRPGVDLNNRQRGYIFADIVYELIQGLMMKSGDYAALHFSGAERASQ